MEEIKKAMNYSKEMDEDDVLIFADIDEMLSREALLRIKNCELRGNVVSGAITMPMGNLDMAFRSVSCSKTLII